MQLFFVFVFEELVTLQPVKIRELIICILQSLLKRLEKRSVELRVCLRSVI